MTRPATDAAAWPTAKVGWTAVGLLFVIYILSFIDRTILSLLVEPIKADLQLSDVQIGLVSGLAFGVFYAVMGLPLGWLVDRYSRRAVIAGGIALWSIATAACGFAESFGALFAARVLVGIGEAALSPAALSLIADLFPPERRSLAIGVFVMAGSVGGGVAMIAGGSLIGWVESGSLSAIPLLGTLAPWQAVFVLVAAPGAPMCAAMMLLPEPSRRGLGDASAGFVRFLKNNFTVLGPLFAAMTLLAIVAYGYLAWLPTLFIRVHGWTATEVGVRLGLVFLLFGAAGAVSGGALAAAARQRDHRTANLRVVTIGLGTLAPVVVAAPLMTGPWLTLMMLAPVMFLFAFPSGVAATAVQEIAPAGLRGRTTALYYLSMSLFGLALGAPLVAFLSESVFSGSEPLRPALASCGLLIIPAAILAKTAWSTGGKPTIPCASANSMAGHPKQPSQGDFPQ